MAQGRRLVSAVLALGLLGLAACTGGSGSDSGAGGGTGGTPADPFAAAPSLFDAVDPLIGTAPAPGVDDPVPLGSGGNVFPGAVAPFGGIQWSPDTPDAEIAYAYAYNDDRITGFSLTHFSGAGCNNGGLFSFLPGLEGVGAVEGASFSHDDEVARPGTYRVTLGDGTEVRLAASTRSGIGSFTYPAGGRATVLLDASSRVPGNDDPGLRVVSDRVIEGTESDGHFCATGLGYPMHLRAEFDQPFTAEPVSRRRGTEVVDGLRLRFAGEPAGGEPTTVRVRLALSPVSTEGAAANLRAEQPSWDLDEAERQAHDRWRDLLDRVRVAGGTDEQRTIFATALYHSFIHPSTFSDVDGRYPGFDGEVRTVPKGHVHYHTFSGWDIYRSQVQLLAVLAPDVAADAQTTLLANAEACGGGFDKWSLGNVESNVMVGDPGALMVTNLDAFGVTGPDAADPDAVLPVLRRSALDPATTCAPSGRPLRPALADLLEKGWVAADTSTTLEYAVADAAIAAYAERHDDAELAEAALAGARRWRNLFNPDTGYLGARNPHGDWVPWADPGERLGFVEGNSAQYTWMVPQDYAGLIERVGGREAAVARLDELFEKVNVGIEQPHFYIGNEPLFPVPWAYNWAGAPAKAQDAVRRVIDEAFSAEPGGIPGNDDLGATSSWLVWASLGVFPVVPGRDTLVLNTPTFDAVRLQVPDREPIDLLAAGAGDGRYLAGVAVDGRAEARSWLRYADLADGAVITFERSARPTDWATEPDAAPPSPAG